LLRALGGSVECGAVGRQCEVAALTTLRKMAYGGFYDQLGGGFTAIRWMHNGKFPHFEKMLYDNGPLVGVVRAGLAVRAVIRYSALWPRRPASGCMRDMQAPEGGYYATLDADSEGEEGKFYLWTPDQVRELLSTEEYVAFAVCHGLEQPPNFENHAWHPRRIAEPSELASRLAVAPEQVDEWLATARRKLLEARSQRIWPGRDEKILTAWNGLTIRGMAIAGRHLGRADFVALRRSARWILSMLTCGVTAVCWRSTRTSRVGSAPIWMITHFLSTGILDLLQCRWRHGDLDFALALADMLLEQFEDQVAGGFYFTADRSRALDPAAQAGAR
jgi:uncharacterized protein YyaL (SSP411 family)